MRVGLNLRAGLIVAPLVVAMLALALAPIGSYLSLRSALHDVRREIASLLQLSKLDDAAQIEGSLALRKSLDTLLASSARLSLASPSAGLVSDAQRLRAEAAEAIAVARLAGRAQRLVSACRGFAYLGESRERLAVAEHRLDRAYAVWEVQAGARGEEAGANEGDIHVGYRALKEAADGLAGLDPEKDRAAAIRHYESRLAPLGIETLPRVLTAAFETRDVRISALVDSIARHSRYAGAASGAVAGLALALALLCPWLISRWIVRPVQARERLRQAERLAAVGTLASGIAHQINNPLNNILLTAEHALGEVGFDAAWHRQTALEACIEEARRCERIVRGLVDFARGKPGETWTEDANRLLERARDLAAACAAQHRATVELAPSASAVPIRASPIALEQALVNIIQNAVESRPEARVELRAERRGEIVRITVRDDGRGMDGEAIRHLFDPFFTTRAAEGGTGLGLSVAHRIITDHHGTIDVDSRPGEGTLVTVELPLAGEA